MVDNNTTHPSYLNEISNQFKRYEHTIFCPNPMCEANIGVAHTTEQDRMAFASLTSGGGQRGVGIPPRTHTNSIKKYINTCKCTNQINCSV